MAVRRSVGTRPRSSRTIGRTSKMNSLVASSAWLTMRAQGFSSPGGARRRADEPLHDLRLERDVGEALRRPVVHLAGDLPAQLLLGAQHRRPVGSLRAGHA